MGNIDRPEQEELCQCDKLSSLKCCPHCLKLKPDYDKMQAELQQLRDYVGSNMLRSDYPTVDSMRAELERYKVRCKELAGVIDDEKPCGCIYLDTMDTYVPGQFLKK